MWIVLLSGLASYCFGFYVGQKIEQEKVEKKIKRRRKEKSIQKGCEIVPSVPSAPLYKDIENY